MDESMRRVLAVLVLLTPVAGGAAVARADVTPKELSEIIAKGGGYVEKRMYDSAYRALDGFSQKHESPDVEVMKADIALKYNIRAINHEAFCFADLKEGESLSAEREKSDDRPLYVFQVSEKLGALVEKHPTHGGLRRVLGEYYYEVAMRYGDRWQKPRSELLRLAEDNSLRARELKAHSHYTLFIIGTIKLGAGKHGEALDFLLESARLKGDYPPCNFNIAYAQFLNKRMKEGLPYARAAFDQYEEKGLKAESARMVGVILDSLGDRAASIDYYVKADALEPGNHFTLRGLMSLYLDAGVVEKADSTADSLFAIQPKNPALPEDILSAYYRHGRKSDVLRFFDRMEARYGGDAHVLGNINFYRGKYYVYENDPSAAAVCLGKARESFLRVFPPDHRVFGVIDAAVARMRQAEEKEQTRKK